MLRLHVHRRVEEGRVVVAREGDLHAAYYAKKREAFAQGTAGTISINKDFGGAIVQGQQ